MAFVVPRMDSHFICEPKKADGGPHKHYQSNVKQYHEFSYHVLEMLLERFLVIPMLFRARKWPTAQATGSMGAPITHSYQWLLLAPIAWKNQATLTMAHASNIKTA